MKITAIEAVPLAIPLRPMNPPSPWTGGTRKQIFVRVHTDEGRRAGSARPSPTARRSRW